MVSITAISRVTSVLYTHETIIEDSLSYLNTVVTPETLQCWRGDSSSG